MLWLPTIRFADGPVPVVITHYLEPIAKSTLEAKLEVLEVIGTGKVKLGVKAGTEYKNKQWSTIWEPSRSGSVGLKLGDDQFKVTLSDELAFGLGYTALLYSTAGPELGLTLGATLSGSASPDTCKWDAKLELGINFEHGAELQVPVLDKKIWDASGKVELFKKKIVGIEGDIPACLQDAGVEAGCFVRGSPATEFCRGTAIKETQHKVWITRGFEIGQTEVTQGQYLAVMGSNPAYLPRHVWDQLPGRVRQLGRCRVLLQQAVQQCGARGLLHLHGP